MGKVCTAEGKTRCGSRFMEVELSVTEAGKAWLQQKVFSGRVQMLLYVFVLGGGGYQELWSFFFKRVNRGKKTVPCCACAHPPSIPYRPEIWFCGYICFPKTKVGTTHKQIVNAVRVKISSIENFVVAILPFLVHALRSATEHSTMSNPTRI